MEQFAHVMVLISVIIGIGIAQILLGLGRIVDRKASGDKKFKLSPAHIAWLAHTFVWMVTFWWWQFRLTGLELVWTLGLYLFLVLYSVSLFLMAVVLVPLSEKRIETLEAFFLERRQWFYGLFLFATLLDIAEGYVKGGWDRVLDQGPWVWSLWFLAIPIGCLGIISRRARLHDAMAIGYLSWNIVVGFVDLPTLAG